MEFSKSSSIVSNDQALDRCNGSITVCATRNGMIQRTTHWGEFAPCHLGTPSTLRTAALGGLLQL